MIGKKPPYIVIVMGLPGSGKTYFARQLASAVGAIHISSDQVRRQYQEMGHYTLSDKRRVYRKMLELATDHLQNGQSVLLDGTFHWQCFRQLAEDFAKSQNYPLFYLEVVADEATIRERITQPRPDSEANYAVYKLLQQQYEPLQKPYLQLDSSHQSIDQMLEVAQNYLR